MAFDYDLFVIGGGSGGVRAARVASSEYGAKVAIAEEYRMGGTCVIRGCVPKKLMVFASSFAGQMEDARAYGWDVSNGGFDWPSFRAKLDAELDRLEAVYRRGLVNAGVTIHDDRAVLEDAHTVRLAGGARFTAKHILIATGGFPAVPEPARAAGVMTSNDVFKLDRLPKSILIVGGGFIACEFACILNGMGVEVTQFYRGEQILRGFDGEARGHIAELMRESGVNLHVGTDVIEMRNDPDGTWVKSTDGRERVFEKVLYATGRGPSTAGLGLAEAGVKLGRRGEVVVDAWSQTSVPSIYAVGDVTDRVNLTPVAIREGHAFADTVFGAKPTKPDHELVASAVFTQPEFGTVGLTEEEARDNGPIEVYATSFRAMQTAFAGRADRVMMKLIVCADTRRVLGCHIVAPVAGEMIQLAAVAIKMGATKEDFDRTVAVHPVMAEELVTLRKPVRTA
ncbi:glutathione-disulfide reductase [Defluviimonas sp. WL0075]|uniref:Glutathione-disulfide reductase n=1 Tax=Albidovulum sediminicola TaxID=2984331 RepID=A0ABT2Z2T9_9RHOB|nr:glutathione-disulfide reductase [Defluviimonas sp. WL0075]MCV2865427.1 glutathione-disulfide reductase [Defluviimonas sp. WL0075]